MAEQTLETNAANPYAAPSAELTEKGSLAEAEALRREHIRHEASVRGLGLLYYLTAVLMLFGMVGVLAASTETGVDNAAGLFVGGLLMAGFGVAWGLIGYGLRRLRSWARVPTAVLSIFGLFAFPLGTLLNAYFLYLVLSTKGRTVFSAEYAEARKLTPHVKYRSIFAWIALLLIILLVLAVTLPVAMERM